MKTAALLTLLLPLSLSAAPPVISNVTASQRAGTKLVDIRYDVADPDSASLTIQIELSANGGQTYELPVRSLTGAVGSGVAPGTSRLITWNAGADWNGNWSPNCKARLWAHDGSTPVPPLGMVYIPSGTFDMGSGPGVIGVPVTLTKSYFMDRTEVSAELWNEVRNWGSANGYRDGNGTPTLAPGSFRALGHPIQTVNWYACAVWCNARSEKEGLTPCYYTDNSHTTVYRGATNLDLTNGMVNWIANGYRLPTEAEWERAARGGLYRKSFSWGDELDGSMANFLGSGDAFETNPPYIPPGTTPIGYYNGQQLPAGSDMANGFGLHDVDGNVAEWCWDLRGGVRIPATDPKGPDVGDPAGYRSLKGGTWRYSYSAGTQLLGNLGAFPVNESIDFLGFRPVRGL